MIRTDHAKVLKYVRANENLSHLFEYYLNTCITQTNPYHNTNHTMAMMYHICCIYEESNRGKYEFVIDEQGLYILLVCAIFHDYNHSAGKFNDNTNVSTAIDAMKLYFNNNFQAENPDRLNRLKDICSNTILATCYPYVIEDEDLDLYQRIIRECDILVAFADDFFTQTLIGLKTEMLVKDWKEFLANETKFLLSSWNELKLDYSKDLVKEHSESILSIINELAEIFK